MLLVAFGALVLVPLLTGLDPNVALFTAGLGTLVRAGYDEIMRPRSLVIVAIILVFGVGGMQISTGGFMLGGIGLAGIAGILLNLILPGREGN